jgi:tellurite methyltransferase
MRDFDNFYREKERPFGTEPVKIVGNIPKYKSSGTALELGAGDGRNAIFLAANGFEVTAQDISGVALEKLHAQAEEKGLHVETKTGDATEMELSGEYDVLVVTYLLHFLTREKALQLMERVKAQTKPGGLNAIGVITADGDFFRNHPDTEQYFPGKTEMLDMYADWEILEHSAGEAPSDKTRPDGSPMTNVVERLLARKK